MSTELQILLTALAPGTDTERVRRFNQLLGSGIDWSYLLRLARHHYATPLLRTRLQPLAHQAMPEWVAAEMKQSAIMVAASALRLSQESTRVLTTLEAHHIPVMPYKGVFLAEQLYGDAGLRPAGDIDLIVPQVDVMRAVQCLRSEMGYVPDFPFHSARQEELYLRQIHHYGLIHPQSKIRVEVHWDLAMPGTGFAVAWDDVWARARPDSWHDVSIMRPDSEDQLIFLAIHGSKHRWESLRWLADVGELLAQTPDLDWTTVNDRAEQWRAVRALQLTLRLCRDLLGVTVKCQPIAPVDQLVEEVVSLLDQDGEPLSPNWRRINYRLLLQDRHPDRLRMAWNWIFGLNFQDMPQADAPKFAVYANRPLRLLRKRGIGGVASILKQTARGLRS